ncbi:MAG TPA: CBS domain-containing protein [Acidimicrobiales bacterium]|jgi:predicted transcriptional regulator/sporulation protein YlmC with PRC-barrel domain
MSPGPPSLPHPSALLHRRVNRLLTNRATRAELISVAGLVGQPVLNPNGEQLGRVADVVARWEGEEYPPITGLVVRVGRRSSFVTIDQVDKLEAKKAHLRSGRVDLVGYNRRPGEVALVGDVLDHQLVDVDGVRVIRAADLYVTHAGGRLLLVGVDVGMHSLLRRLGPASLRARATPDRVLDWAAIQPFAAGQGQVPLRSTNQELHRLRPAELADLLEQLGRTQRQELLGALQPDVAADALEEMESAPLAALLREAPEEQVASLLESMEPDEAVEALRDLDEERQGELLGAMSADRAAALGAMLRYPATTAGGIMTTRLLIFEGSATIGEAREQLRAMADHAADIDNVSVVDAMGRLVDEISLFEIATALNDEVRLRELMGEPWPITVDADASIGEVIECLAANRRSSVVVVDEDEHPLGRILADDLIDALASDRGRLRFPRVVE